MSKKINPNIFRLGKTKTWASQYFEKKPSEAPIYDFKTLEIKKFIYKFFKNNGLLVHDCKIYYSNENFLDIFVSYYLSMNAVKISQAISNKQNITIRAKKFFEADWFLNKFKEYLKNKRDERRYIKQNKPNKHNDRKYVKHNKPNKHNDPRDVKHNNLDTYNKFRKKKVFNKYVNFYDVICSYRSKFKQRASRQRFYFKNKLIIDKLNIYNFKAKKRIRKIVKPIRVNYFKYQNTNDLKNLFKILAKKYYLTLITKCKQAVKAKKQKFLIIKKYNQTLKKTLKTKRLKFLTIYKKYLAIKKYKTIKAIENNTFLSKFFESLHLFINKKTNIRLNICQLNKKLKNNFYFTTIKHLNKKLGSLRKFRQNDFFKDGVNLMFNSTLQSNSADLIARFIATQLKKLKRHNFFLIFIKTTFLIFINSNFSNLKGIKIKIKGRINSRPRARHRTINIGKGVPSLTINSKIDYSEKTSYTSNGTLGVKIWTHKK